VGAINLLEETGGGDLTAEQLELINAYGRWKPLWATYTVHFHPTISCKGKNMHIEESQLDKRKVAQYEEEGIIKIDLPPNIIELQQQFLRECCRWVGHFGKYECSSETFARDLIDIAQTDRSLVAKLYKVSRRFVSAKQLASEPYFVACAKTIMGTESVSCCHLVNVRFDLPGESKYSLESHQDFPYIQGSVNGITIWMPFFDISQEMGAPSWIPGSHRWGALKVREYSLGQVGGSGGKSFVIADTEHMEGKGFVKGVIKSHEALLFSTLLVHRSEPNISETARISIQVRFDDAYSQASFTRNYPEGLYLNNRLNEAYPELVENGG
jgi:hypothetical protein